MTFLPPEYTEQVDKQKRMAVLKYQKYLKTSPMYALRKLAAINAITEEDIYFAYDNANLFNRNKILLYASKLGLDVDFDPRDHGNDIR